jgi:hypothetical protein
LLAIPLLFEEAVCGVDRTVESNGAKVQDILTIRLACGASCPLTEREWPLSYDPGGPAAAPSRGPS